MGGGNDPLSGVIQQHRHTIGRRYPDNRRGHIRYQRIDPIQPPGTGERIQFQKRSIDKADFHPVHLTGETQLRIRHTESTGQPGQIATHFGYVAARI